MADPNEDNRPTLPLGKKILLGVIVLCLVGFFYGHAGPFYRTTVVDEPFSFSEGADVEFTVDKEETYDISLFVDTLDSSISSGRLKRGDIDLTWTVTVGQEIVADGRFREATDRGRSPWRQIGEVTAAPVNVYTLSVHSNAEVEEWDALEHRLRVNIHPTKLEGYLVISLLSLLVGALTTAGLIVIFIAEGIRNQFRSRRT